MRESERRFRQSTGPGGWPALARRANPAAAAHGRASIPPRPASLPGDEAAGFVRVEGTGTTRGTMANYELNLGREPANGAGTVRLHRLDGVIQYAQQVREGDWATLSREGDAVCRLQRLSAEGDFWLVCAPLTRVA